MNTIACRTLKNLNYLAAAVVYLRDKNCRDGSSVIQHCESSAIDIHGKLESTEYSWGSLEQIGDVVLFAATVFGSSISRMS